MAKSQSRENIIFKQTRPQEGCQLSNLPKQLPLFLYEKKLTSAAVHFLTLPPLWPYLLIPSAPVRAITLPQHILGLSQCALALVVPSECPLSPVSPSPLAPPGAVMVRPREADSSRAGLLSPSSDFRLRNCSAPSLTPGQDAAQCPGPSGPAHYIGHPPLCRA